MRFLLKFITVFAVSILLMMLLHPLFLLFHVGSIGQGATFGNSLIPVVTHGFRMDLSVAAYISAIPGLLIALSVLPPMRRFTAMAEKIYFLLTAAVIAAIVVLDIALYGYWHFRLDMTPLFYLSTSPRSALASVEGWMYPVGIVAWLALGAAIYAAYRFTALLIPSDPRVDPNRIRRPGTRRTRVSKEQVRGMVCMLLPVSTLAIPIRGGITVSTMNLSSSYFSEIPGLNQAAVNPIFSLLDSAVHQDDFTERYSWLPAAEAARLATPLLNEGTAPALPDSIRISTRITGRRPDIYIFILESYSSYLFPSLGGQPVATRLDSIAQSGLLFTNFHANGFRTDRGLTAILSSFPGLPDVSVMKSVARAATLPSLAKALRPAGYKAEYYYGGDANFTNMNAWLVNMGFTKIMRDTDFPLAERTGKWGAHDGPLLQRVPRTSTGTPTLRVIQTSSSHEPFEVPYDNPGFRSDRRLNAFAYTDSVTATYIATLARTPQWDNALIILVGDHWGVWPDQLPDGAERHRIPLIMTGGALPRALRAQRIGTPSSQIDIAATLLGMLNIPCKGFLFSNDILNPASPHYASWCGRTRGGLIFPDGESMSIDFANPKGAAPLVKAYFQTVAASIAK